MSNFTPKPVPQNIEELQAYLGQVFDQLQAALDEGVDSILLPELHAAPAKPRNGRIVYADGTDWNPGSGRGFYGYSNGAWRFLG